MPDNASNPMLNHFKAMALYNQRSNKILYEACAKLTDEDRKKTRPVFFGSIHATLNHILLGDLIWITRFEGGTFEYAGLASTLYDDFDELVPARQEMDARISAFVDQLSPSWFEREFAYVNNSGTACNDPAAVLLAHLFNHQTHHRGQVHTLLSDTPVPPPSMDLHRVVLD